MPTVLITGTSTGIGHVTTEVLASRGWRVFATMRDLTKKGLFGGCLGACGRSGSGYDLPTRHERSKSIHAAVASILAQTDNAIDAVVHNAGVAVAGALEDIPRIGNTTRDGDEFLRRAGVDAFAAADLSRAKKRPRRRRSRAKRALQASPRTRSTAPRNGRSRAGPNRLPTNSTPSASTSSLSSRALTKRKSGEAPLA